MVTAQVYLHLTFLDPCGWGNLPVRKSTKHEATERDAIVGAVMRSGKVCARGESSETRAFSVPAKFKVGLR